MIYHIRNIVKFVDPVCREFRFMEASVHPHLSGRHRSEAVGIERKFPMQGDTIGIRSMAV